MEILVCRGNGRVDLDEHAEDFARLLADIGFLLVKVNRTAPLSLPKIPSLFIYKGLRTIANSRKTT